MGVAEDFAPSFVKKPQLHQEDDGNRLIFECQLLSSPKPDIEWFRSDSKLAEDERTKFKIQPVEDNKYTVILELDDVVETDAGLYKVKAKNKSGEVSASINLNFTPADEPKEKQIDGFAPTFAKKPAIRQEEDGKRLLFECRVNADPMPNIIWFHNGVAVKESARHKLTVDKEVHSYFATLEIQNVTVEDAGKYKVNAKNELGESNATISLNFDSASDANGFAPSFIEKPRIIPNESGTLITMKCKCKAKPEPTVTWYRGQDAVEKSKKIKINTVVIAEDTYELTLEIKDPGANDGGTYRCNVKNEYGESNANLNLNIEAEPEPEGEGPTFVEKPRIVSENNGKLVIMECKVKADPKPDVVWFRNGEVIKESNKIKTFIEQRGDQYYIKLELLDPQLEDSGLYKCNIKNTLGELNANLTLNIEIVPVIKDKPKIIKIIKKRTVVIECTVASKFEPKCTWYKESNTVKESKRHVYLVEQTKDGEFAVKLEINEVEESDKGAYKLVASNEKGEAVSQVVNLIDIPEEERKPSKPEISRKLVDQKVTESKTFELLISLAQSDRKCKIEWYRGSTLLRETKDVTTTFDGTTARLTFSSAKTEHTSNYKVVVSNEVGKDESSCKITVEKGTKKPVEQPKEKDKLKEEKEKEQKKQTTEQIGLKKVERKASIVSVKEEVSETRRQSIIEAREEITVDNTKVLSRKSSLAVEESSKERRRSSVIDKTPMEQVDSKQIDANKNPQALKEEIPKLKPAEKRRPSKAIEEAKPAEELPKLRKTSIAQAKEEPKPEVAKPKAKPKAKSKPKYEELPEIPDYERPQLEKYEKSDFTPSDFARELDIPNKMEKPLLDSGKKESEAPAQKNGLPKKAEIVEKTAEEPKGLKLGKGKLPSEDDSRDGAVLKPVIIEPEEEKKVPRMQPPAPGEPPKIEVIREKRPSLAPEPPSRRGSLIPPADTGRRPSLIINDEVSGENEVKGLTSKGWREVVLHICKQKPLGFKN